MHPVELIEYGFASVTLLFIFIVSLILKGKWRKIGFSTLIVYAILCVLFFLIRPTYRDTIIEYKVELLNTYLENTYRDTTWEIWTVPHRNAEYKSLNYKNIKVTFADEPNITYVFSVNNDQIKNVGFSGSTNGKRMNDF